MRRRLSLILLGILVVLAVLVSTRYQSLGREGSRRVASSTTPRDSLATADSAAADARQEADTMCFASRFGLPCDPR